MNYNKRAIAFSAVLYIVSQLFAQGPNGSGTYYQTADGKCGSGLKTAMCGIVNQHTQLTYGGLWDAYRSTDCREDGMVWDMYSNMTNYEFGTDQVGQNGHLGGREGDGYNREHSMPASWFGSNYPMYTDLMHIVPVDGWVNSMRGNNPFGETYSPTNQSSEGFSKIGTSAINDYAGLVFEPNDEYKGDFARIYFYMATCYEHLISGWSSPMLAENSYPVFTDWALNMLLRWAAEDPVSRKEIDRNNAVSALQGNRNPYVDYPGLEQYVWGGSSETAFSYDNYVEPTYVYDPSDESVTYRKVNSESDLMPGCTYLIVCESRNVAMGSTSNTYRSDVGITISDGIVETKIGGEGQPRGFVLGGSKGEYTFYDGVENVYLALNASENQLHGSTTVGTDNERWTITIDDGCTVSNNAYTDRFINYNASANRFACYRAASRQQAVALYKSTTSTGIANVTADGVETKVDVYNLIGVKVRSRVDAGSALRGLERGVYIIGKRKYLVK